MVLYKEVGILQQALQLQVLPAAVVMIGQLLSGVSGKKIYKKLL